MTNHTSLNLDTISSIHNRPLSVTEYYHACVGSSKHSLEVPRECICVLEGEFEHGFENIDIDQWQQAVEQAARANPGACLSMRGKGRHAVWNSDGAKPRVRRITGIDWDGNSNTGSEFITELPLELTGDASAEIILADGNKQFVIFRVLHAVMDGVGFMHFFQEVFRALRGEPLIGTNTTLTDLQLMSMIEKHKVSRPKGVPPYATGGPRGNQTGDSWKVIRLRGTKPNTLARTILAVAQTAAIHSDRPARIALPVDLRRHFPGLTSTMNYTSMVHMDVHPDTTPEQVTERIKWLLSQNTEANFPGFLDLLKIIPMPLMDSLVSRTTKNYTRRRLVETAVISSLGLYKPAKFSGGGFLPRQLFTVPVPGNTMLSISSLGRETCVSIGTENIYASEGRLDQLANKIKEAIAR